MINANLVDMPTINHARRVILGELRTIWSRSRVDDYAICLACGDPFMPEPIDREIHEEFGKAPRYCDGCQAEINRQNGD